MRMILAVFREDKLSLPRGLNVSQACRITEVSSCREHCALSSSIRIRLKLPLLVLETLLVVASIIKTAKRI